MERDSNAAGSGVTAAHCFGCCVFVMLLCFAAKATFSYLLLSGRKSTSAKPKLLIFAHLYITQSARKETPNIGWTTKSPLFRDFVIVLTCLGKAVWGVL